MHLGLCTVACIPEPVNDVDKLKQRLIKVLAAVAAYSSWRQCDILRHAVASASPALNNASSAPSIDTLRARLKAGLRVQCLLKEDSLRHAAINLHTHVNENLPSLLNIYC